MCLRKVLQHAKPGHLKSVVPLIDALIVSSKQHNDDNIDAVISELIANAPTYNVSSDQINTIRAVALKVARGHTETVYSTLEESGFRKKWFKSANCIADS